MNLNLTKRPKPSRIPKFLAAGMMLTLCFAGIPVGTAAVKGAKGTSTSFHSGGTLQSAGQVNAPEGTPTREIQDIEVKMEAYDTRPNASSDIKANNTRIKREILNGTFDLRELARLSLDRHWGGLAAQEQGNFVGLLTELLETKAIFSKEQSRTQNKSYVVEYLGDIYSDNKTMARTKTQVTVPKENVRIDIEYKLKKGASGWRVYDIIVDDASLVENYRYQFDTIISKNGYSELVNRMRKKLAELRAKG